MDCSPPGSFVHGNSPVKNTGVGYHALLQGIFPTQGLNTGLLHFGQILYCLSLREAHLMIPLSSVAQSCPTLCKPMDCSTPGFPVLHCPLSPGVCSNSTSVESVMSSNYLILCHPLFLLPSIFPSIGVFSSVSALCIRWPKYWSFSFSIGPSNEYPGLICFRMDWLDLLAVYGALKESSPTSQFKSINSSVLSFLSSPTHTSIHDYWKNHSLD